MSENVYASAFDAARMTRLRDLVHIPEPVHVARLDATDDQRLREVEVLITGWGAPRIGSGVLDQMPHLRIILHMAGTVKRIIDPVCWDRDIVVTTAADANAVPVAEYTIAAILFAGKRVIESARLYRTDPSRRPRPHGITSNYRRCVGVIGHSRIGRRVVELLRPFDLDVLVADPYAEPEQVAQAGARLVDLDELLAASDIVSVHVPALPETARLLNRERLALVGDGATIINTARGSIIDTAALEAECVAGRLNAILDVTDPEPLPSSSPLWTLPNVLLTPHIAGALTTEIGRLADTILDDLERYIYGDRPRHAVTADDLPRIA